MCGGDIEVSQDMTVGKCLFCGSTMTLPRIDSDKKVRLFNRANEYRLNNGFDKAYDAFKSESLYGSQVNGYIVFYDLDGSIIYRKPVVFKTDNNGKVVEHMYDATLPLGTYEIEFLTF